MARRKSIYVSDKDWDQYKQIINDFIDIDSGKQPFLYLQKIEQPLSYGEDSGVIYTPIQLDGLFQYNYIKTWPTNKQSISGALPTISVCLSCEIQNYNSRHLPFYILLATAHDVHSVFLRLLQD